MKRFPFNPFTTPSGVFAAGLLVAPLAAHAGNIIWDAGPAGTDTDWAVDANWAGDLAPADNLTVDNGYFNTLTAGQPAVSGTRSVAGIELQTPTGGWNIGGTGTLNIGAKGIDATAFENGTNTISVANIVVGTATAGTWALSVGANTATQPTITTISSNIQLHKTSQLNVNSPRGGTGGAGTINLSGVISNTTGETASGVLRYLGGSAGKNTFNVTGLNTYNAQTVVSQAVVNFNSLADDGTPSALGQSGIINVTDNTSFATLTYNGTAPATTNRRLTIGQSSGTTAAGAANIGNNATDPLHTLSFTATTSVIAGGDAARSLVLLGNNTGNNTFAQSIDNAGTGITTFGKQNAGRWLLTNPNNSYTGATTLAGGFLGVVKLSNGGANSSIGASASTAANLVFNGGELTYNGTGDDTDRLMSLAANGTIRNNGTGSLVFTNTGSITHSNTATGRLLVLGGTYAGVNTFAPVITPTGAAGTTGVRFENTTIWELSGLNTYTGVTTINFGAKAQITSDQNLGAATGAGQLLISGTLICNETLTLNTARGIYAGSPTAAGTAIIEVAATKTVTHDGVISNNLGGSAIGADGLTKTGAGTLSLGAANTYTGTTTVNGGTLALGSAGSFDTSPTLSIAAGATLDLSAKAAAFPIPAAQTLTGSGSVIGQSLDVAGTVNPGTGGIGTLSTAALSLGATSIVNAQFDSSALTADKLAVTGDLTIDPASVLNVADIATLPTIVANGTKLTLATYTGTLTGTFNGRPEGSTVTVGSNNFTLSYVDSNAITLTSINVADPYASWIDGFTSLTNPADKAKGADPDNDGVENAIEFLVGGDPTSSADMGKLWVGTSGGQLVLSIAIRGESTTFSGSPSPATTMEGITCAVQGSTDLADFGSTVSGITFVQPSGWPVTAPTGFSYHSFKLDASAGLSGKGFLRLQGTF